MLSLKKIEKDEFAKIYADMTIQFPACELKPRTTLENLISIGDYQVRKLYDKNTEIGYCSYYIDKETNTIWLDYIAVYRTFHSKGYGSKFLELLKEETCSFNGMYLEVEKPDLNDKNTLRRIRFYEKAGAKKLDCCYFYPNQDGCLEMDLYYFSLKETCLPKPIDIKQAITNVFNVLHKDIRHICDVLDRILI